MPPDERQQYWEAIHRLGDGCVYCGEEDTYEDHFRPVVAKGGLPTGFCSDQWNLVPCCQPCNCSKGNRNWLVFMQSPTPCSPRGRRVKDWRRRVNLLHAFDLLATKYGQRWDTKPVAAALMKLRQTLRDNTHTHFAAAGVLKEVASRHSEPAQPAILTFRIRKGFKSQEAPDHRGRTLRSGKVHAHVSSLPSGAVSSRQRARVKIMGVTAPSPPTAKKSRAAVDAGPDLRAKSSAAVSLTRNLRRSLPSRVASSLAK